MKIVEVAPGAIPIPHTGFGAIERVIWELHLALSKRGHTVLIHNQPILDPHDLPDRSLVHCHWPHHAHVLAEFNIPYAYTSHSHIWSSTDYDAIMGSDIYLALHDGMVPAEYKGRVRVIGNGVGEYWADTNVERLPYTVVACSNYSERKRLEWTAELIDILPPPWTGKIIGPNVPEKLAHLESGRLTLCREKSIFELKKIYNECTVGFHPAREEAFALVPLEMSACGLFTLVSEDCYVYGPPLYSFKTVEDAAKMILNGEYGDPEGCSQYTLENFSWNVVAIMVEEELGELDEVHTRRRC